MLKTATKPSCKVGDTVWIPHEYNPFWQQRFFIIEATVTAIGTHDDGTEFVHTNAEPFAIKHHQTSVGAARKSLVTALAFLSPAVAKVDDRFFPVYHLVDGRWKEQETSKRN